MSGGKNDKFVEAVTRGLEPNVPIVVLDSNGREAQRAAADLAAAGFKKAVAVKDG